MLWVIEILNFEIVGCRKERKKVTVCDGVRGKSGEKKEGIEGYGWDYGGSNVQKKKEGEGMVVVLYWE